MRNYMLAMLVPSLDVAWGALKIKQQPASDAGPAATPPAPGLPALPEPAHPNAEWEPEEWHWPSEANHTKKNHTTKKFKMKYPTLPPDPGIFADSPAPVFEMYPDWSNPNYNHDYELAEMKRHVENPRGKCPESGACEMRNGEATGMALGMGIGLLMEFLEGLARDKPKGIDEKAMDQVLWMFGVGYLGSTIGGRRGWDRDVAVEQDPNADGHVYYDERYPERLGNELEPPRKSQFDYYRYKIPTNWDEYPVYIGGNDRYFIPGSPIRRGNHFLHRGDYQNLNKEPFSLDNAAQMITPEEFQENREYNQWGLPYRYDELGNSKK